MDQDTDSRERERDTKSYSFFTNKNTNSQTNLFFEVHPPPLKYLIGKMRAAIY